ncbi:hypothetical protein BGY98DRAFT_504980 [Russula aff. rugulosa BPL654]|nr:hypothetical protein BGY98DRAFT_1192851 [Russula aff. rugulosa BPL654]KAI0278706.1 hypothetical protein BGY98DRAFT_504980 [Russula aff. rugulosa BPL654]
METRRRGFLHARFYDARRSSYSQNKCCKGGRPSKRGSNAEVERNKSPSKEHSWLAGTLYDGGADTSSVMISW